MELVTKEDPVLPSLGALGGKPCSSCLAPSADTGVPAAEFAAAGSVLSPDRDEHTSNNNIRVVLINRIRTKPLCRETPYALGRKPTLNRKTGNSALSSRLFQELLGPPPSTRQLIPDAGHWPSIKPHLTRNGNRSIAALELGGEEMGPLGVSTTPTMRGNMKKPIGYCSVVAVAGLFAGCFVPVGTVGGVAGWIYTDASGPILATSHASSSKMGEATSQGILGFATGDSSIRTAAANAGITKIQHVDYHTTSVLGVWAKTTVIVCGD